MIWYVVFGVGVFILGWEVLALLDGQKRIPTWSRLIRGIWQNDRPELRPVVFVVSLTIGMTIAIWVSIHLVMPEIVVP